MKNIKRMNATTMIAVSILLMSGGSLLSDTNNGTIISTSYASSSNTYKKVNTGSSNLNVRQEPKSNAKVIGSLKSGSTVQIYGQSGNWYKVSVNGKYGWASKDYLINTSAPSSKSSNSSNTSSNNTYKKVNTGSSNLNVRQEPKSNAKVIGSLKSGSTVQVYGQSGNWYKVSVNGKYGWASKDYLINTSAPASTSSNSSTTSSNTNKNNNTRYIKIGSKEQVPVYSSASNTSKVIFNVPAGKSVTITGTKSNGYEQIKYKNKTGYVPSGDLATTIQKVNAYTNDVIYANGGMFDANKKKINTNTNIDGFEQVYITEYDENSKFVKIEYSGKSIYVEKQYITKGIGSNARYVKLDYNKPFVKIYNKSNLSEDGKKAISECGYTLGGGSMVLFTGNKFGNFAEVYTGKTGNSTMYIESNALTTSKPSDVMYYSDADIEYGNYVLTYFKTKPLTLGEKVTVLGFTGSKDNCRLKVQSSNGERFTMYKHELSKNLNVEVAFPFEKGYSTTVYSSNSTKSNIIGKVGAGEKFIMKDRKGDFAYVEFSGKKGYIPMSNIVTYYNASSVAANLVTGKQVDEYKLINGKMQKMSTPYQKKNQSRSLQIKAINYNGAASGYTTTMKNTYIKQSDIKSYKKIQTNSSK